MIYEVEEEKFQKIEGGPKEKKPNYNFKINTFYLTKS